MSQFLYLIPALTVLTGAMILMFMSMYKRFVVKDFILVSSIFLFIALGFTVADLGNSYSVQPYDHFLNNVLTFDSFSNSAMRFLLLCCRPDVSTIMTSQSAN